MSVPIEEVLVHIDRRPVWFNIYHETRRRITKRLYMDFIIQFRHWMGRDDLFEVRCTIQLVLYAYRQDFVCALLTILADACHDYRKLISHITWIALTDMNNEETYCILVCEQTF